MENENDTEIMSSQTANGSSAPGAEVFYGSAVRLAVAEDIVRDICNMVPVIVVSGEKGEGKSTLCRMAVKEIPSDWMTIVFDRTVESFEDVVRTVAQVIGCGEVDVSRSGMNATIEIIGGRLQEIGKQVVTVFDEAEMIYLATLERIRKMLDQLNVEGVKMQVILCGRPLLLENLKQLSIVNFREVPEKRYFIKPLSVEDTGTYIDFLVHDPQSDVSGSYLPAAIRQIYDITGGNISKVHDCAVRISCSDDRDAALAEMVARTKQKKVPLDVVGMLQKSSQPFQRIVRRAVDRMQSLSRRNQMIGGGVLVFLLVLTLLFSGGDKPEGNSIGETEKEAVEQATAPIEKVPAVSEPETVREVAPEKIAAEETQERPEQSQEVDDTSRNVSPESSEVALSQENEEQKLAPVSAEPEIIYVAPEGEVAVLPTVQPEETVETVEESVAQPEETAGDFVAESQPVKIQEPEVSAEEVPDIPAVESDPESLPETHENSPALTDIEEENANQESSGEAPLITPATQKRIVVEPVQPVVAVEAVETPGSESNIVISTLAESEKREIEVITSTPYKVLKTIESPGESSIVETGELERVSLTRVEQDPVEESVSEEIERQEESVEEKIVKPVLSQAIVVEGETTPPAVTNTELPVVTNEVGDTLLENRMEAGFPWLAGRRNGSYTMQLMMLSSEDAEAKIKGILSQRGYKRVSDKFYIFRKNSLPPVYFVFYGEYGNVTEARKARNEIPVFLRNHRPYVLSVPSAMRKVKF